MSARPLRMFVTLGTDHHPFDRLVDWLDEWTPPAGTRVEVLVQHGSTRAPRNHPGRPFLTVEELGTVVTQSDIMLTQGGPGGIMNARQSGLVPIVVPRLASLGEVVDDHQVAFCRRLGSIGSVQCVEDQAGLYDALDLAVLSPDRLRCEPAPSTVDDVTRAAFAAAVQQAVTRRRTGWRGRLPGRPVVTGADGPQLEPVAQVSAGAHVAQVAQDQPKSRSKSA
jgi:UDP-N-acetylglucosamine transferase subunit ALG13